MSCNYVLLLFDELRKGCIHLLDSPSGKIRCHKIIPPGVSDRQDLPDSELHMADLIADGIAEAALRTRFAFYPIGISRPASFPASDSAPGRTERTGCSRRRLSEEDASVSNDILMENLHLIDEDR